MPDHRTRLLFLAGTAAVSFLPGLYYLHLRSQPVFPAAGAAQNLMLSPQPLAYACGLGPLLVLAVIGAVTLYRDPARRRLLVFLLAWVATQLALAYSPFPFQRRLIAGVGLPLAVLAAVALGRLRSRAVVALILLAASLGSLAAIRDQVRTLQRGGMPFYLPVAYVEAFDWLARQPAEGAVLSGFVTGNFIPAYTGFQTCIGHSSLTPDSTEKRRLVEGFFRDPSPELLGASFVQYVFFGAEERRLAAGRRPLELEPAYQGDGVVILSATAARAPR